MSRICVPGHGSSFLPFGGLVTLCKGQLVELQSAKARFEKHGIKLAAISYDSEAILKYFADRQHIDFALLADLNSKAIRDFQVLNTEAVGQFWGMARPGYFFYRPEGLHSGEALRSQVSGEVVRQAPHLEVGGQQSTGLEVLGGRITLITEVRLPHDTHVYAPGTRGYKPIELVIDSAPNLGFRPAIYTQSKVLFMPAIKERVPVFEGMFRIRQDVRVSSAAEFSSSLALQERILRFTEHSAVRRATTKRAFCPILSRWNGSFRSCRSIASAYLRRFDTSRGPSSSVRLNRRLQVG